MHSPVSLQCPDKMTAVDVFQGFRVKTLSSLDVFWLDLLINYKR